MYTSYSRIFLRQNLVSTECYTICIYSCLIFVVCIFSRRMAFSRILSEDKFSETHIDMDSESENDVEVYLKLGLCITLKQCISSSLCTRILLSNYLV